MPQSKETMAATCGNGYVFDKLLKKKKLRYIQMSAFLLLIKFLQVPQTKLTHGRELITTARASIRASHILDLLYSR